MQPPISINVTYNTKNAISDSNIANDDIINRNKIKDTNPLNSNYEIPNNTYNQRFVKNNTRGVFRLQNSSNVNWNTVPDYYIPDTGSKYYDYTEFERNYEKNTSDTKEKKINLELVQLKLINHGQIIKQVMINK